MTKEKLEMLNNTDKCIDKLKLEIDAFEYFIKNRINASMYIDFPACDNKFLIPDSLKKIIFNEIIHKKKQQLKELEKYFEAA